VGGAVQQQPWEGKKNRRKKQKKESQGRTGKGKLFGECGGKCSKCRRRRQLGE
jgi:hypothetical protein